MEESELGDRGRVHKGTKSAGRALCDGPEEAARASERRSPGGAAGDRCALSAYADAVVPTEYGEVRVVVFRDPNHPPRSDLPNEHMALVLGDVQDQDDVLVRIHSECWTGEVLHSLKCDCREQLDVALTTIALAGSGVVLYLRQEGRGIGLGNKIRAYALQAQGLDTVEANRVLGFADDLRDFSIAGEMLASLGVRSVALLTNNPQKLRSLSDSGVRVVSRRPMRVTSNVHNADYLAVKNARMGHDIPFLEGAGGRASSR
jgi:GTP cyclohydrolase II/3,4-dihydroxy 2-butanone 4-phosphate synthase/GTP cyclohydrolase II